MQLPGQLAVLIVRRDERAERDDTRIGKQLANLGNPANILLAVLWCEAEILVQTSSR